LFAQKTYCGNKKSDTKKNNYKTKTKYLSCRSFHCIVPEQAFLLYITGTAGNKTVALKNKKPALRRLFKKIVNY